MDYNLTEGCLKNILEGAEISSPIFQILGIKKITSGSANRQCYSLVVSDGTYSVSHAYAYLATQNNEQILEAGEHAVIEVNYYITTIFNLNSGIEKRILILMDVDILASGIEVCHRIGNPTVLDQDNKNLAGQVLSLNEKYSAVTAALAATKEYLRPMVPVWEEELQEMAASVESLTNDLKQRGKLSEEASYLLNAIATDDEELQRCVEELRKKVGLRTDC